MRLKLTQSQLKSLGDDLLSPVAFDPDCSGALKHCLCSPTLLQSVPVTVWGTQLVLAAPALPVLSSAAPLAAILKDFPIQFFSC